MPPRLAKRRRGERDPEATGSDTEPELEHDTSPTSAAVVPPALAPAGSITKKAIFSDRYKITSHTNEEVLEEQLKRWKSEVYSHFKTPPEIIDVNGEVKYRFICKAHPTATPIVRSRHDDSTSNLKRHIKTCEGQVVQGAQSIEQFAHGSTYSTGKMRYYIALWTACSYRPFEIVSDTYLQRIFLMLYGRATIPSPVTVSRDIREIHATALPVVAALLQAYPGRLHLSVDGWTSANVLSFLGVTVYWVAESKIRSTILDYIHLTRRHTGVYLAEQLANCLREFGIEQKILAVAADNATNNDILASELESLGGMNGAHTRVRCLAHIINLVVKAMISPFRKQKASGEPVDDEEVTLLAELVDDDEDMDIPEIDSDNEDAAEGTNNGDSEVNDYEQYATSDEDNRSLEDIIEDMEASFSLTSAEARRARCAVTKLTALAKRIFHSPTLREDFRISCEVTKCPSLQMKRSVETRWNSMAECINRALQLRAAIDRLLALAKYDKDGAQGLRRYKLSVHEWAILQQLSPILTFFLKATHRVSQMGVPLLHEVIPLIDIMTEKLMAAMENESLEHIVRVAAARGLAVVNKYYAKTDESIMSRLAILLHPMYKTDYMKMHNWPEDWITTARELAHEQWTTYYKPTDNNHAATAPAAHEDDDFAAIDNYHVQQPLDGLENYLNSPTVMCKDPIQWWTVQGESSTDPEFVALARMAVDFLSAPATSVDMERGFTCGGNTVTKRRHNLAPRTTRAAVVVGAWEKVPGFIPEAQLIKAFDNKKKRSPNVAQSEAGPSTNVIEVDSD